MADYYGRNKKVLIQGGIGRPLFIALFEDKIYLSSEWGHQRTGKVFIASRMDGSHVWTLANDVQLVQGQWTVYTLEYCIGGMHISIHEAMY